MIIEEELIKFWCEKLCEGVTKDPLLTSFICIDKINEMQEIIDWEYCGGYIP